MDLLCFCSVLCLLCLCAHLFICALWSPAGKGLTSWLSFVVSTVSSHFHIGTLSQVWYLIVSIPDLCTLTYFQYQISLNAGQKYCRMLQGEHSAILSTFIKLPFSIKTFVLPILSGRLRQVLLYSALYFILLFYH